MGYTTHSITWHEDCLKNMKISLQYYQTQLERLQGTSRAVEQNIALAERQIAQENKFASEADSEGLLDALKAKAEFAKFQNGGSYDKRK